MRGLKLTLHHMTNVSDRSSSGRRLLRRARSIWPLSIRQRILLYLVLGALASLACGGVDYTINANLMEYDVPGRDELSCNVDKKIQECGSSVFANGSCHLSKCVKPRDAVATPLTNCPFGKTNGGAPWTAADCKSQSLAAGCTRGTQYSFGCYGYYCSDQRCGR